MRKIFITVNDGSIARNILRSFVLAKILEEPDVTMGLITHEAKKAAYEKEFGSARVKIFGIPQHELTFFERILSYFIRNGLRTETILMDQRTHLDGRYAAFFIKRMFIYIFGKSRLFHTLVRELFLMRQPSASMSELFLQENPDLLFAADIQAELDFDSISAARKSGTKIVGMIRSWDNPTSRGGLIPYVPETLLAWSPYVRFITTAVQHIAEDKMIITGIPHYDWYTKKEIIMPRAEFLGKLGIDPSKKLILFAGEGQFHAPHEVEVLEILSEKLKKGSIEDSKNIALVFRPHPAFKVDRERAKKIDNVVFDEVISSYTSKDPSSWEMNKEQMVHLVNSLLHADLVITTASTMIVDAVAFNKPVIGIAFDGRSKEPYRRSVRRFYRDYTHHIYLCRTYGFKIAYTSEELVRYVNEYLQNFKLDEEGRNKIFKEFIWKLDGYSAERVVKAILTRL